MTWKHSGVATSRLMGLTERGEASPPGGKPPPGDRCLLIEEDLGGQPLVGGLSPPGSVPQAGTMLSGPDPSPIGDPLLCSLPALGLQGLSIPALLYTPFLVGGLTLE